MAMGLIGGIGLGVMLGLFRELMDRVFRTSAQIEAELGLPCLALVPELAVPSSPCAEPNRVRPMAIWVSE